MTVILQILISCWGGILKYKLNKIFSIQKICIRLLFGKDWSYDHPEYYEICARTRTFAEHMSPKVYAYAYYSAISKIRKRLLFGKDWSYDHPEYYEICARTRTFAEHMSPKVYAYATLKILCSLKSGFVCSNARIGAHKTTL